MELEFGSAESQMLPSLFVPWDCSKVQGISLSHVLCGLRGELTGRVKLYLLPCSVCLILFLCAPLGYCNLSSGSQNSCEGVFVCLVVNISFSERGRRLDHLFHDVPLRNILLMVV